MLSFNDPALVLVLLMLSFNDPALVLVLLMLSFNDPALVLVLLMLSFIALRECSLFEMRRICTCFVLFGYICIAVGDTIIKKSMIGVLLTNLIMPQLVCLSQVFYFHLQLWWLFFCSPWSIICLRSVWRYQRGNQIPEIEEEQTTK
jgi:hypothetical protein